MKSKTCCFTGHRPQKLPWGFDESDERFVAMKARLRAEIENVVELGFVHFISGMALGFDMLAAEIVLELKKQYPKITLECAIPCKGQEKFWHKDAQERYFRILQQADKVSVLSERYFDGCMQARNKYMVEKSSLLIALFDGKSGGTKQTIEYAQSVGLKVLKIMP